MKRRRFIASAAVGVTLSGCLGNSDGDSETTTRTTSTTQSTTEKPETTTEPTTTTANPGDAELNPAWVHDVFTIDIALTDDAVIVPAPQEGVIRAITKRSESVDWEKRVNPVNFDGVTAEGGLVLLQVSQLHVYDEASGEKMWQTDFSGSRIQSATVTENHIAVSQIQYGVSDAPLKLLILDRETGEKVWTVKKSNRVASSLWSDGEKLYAKVGDGLEMYDLDEQKQVGSSNELGVSGLEITENAVYVSAEEGLAKFDKTSLSRKWIYDIEPAQGAPIVSDGNVIAKLQSGLASLDTSSGEANWYRRQAFSDSAEIHETGEYVWTLTPERNLVGYEQASGDLIAKTDSIEQQTDWEGDIEADESALYVVRGSVKRYPVSSLVP